MGLSYLISCEVFDTLFVVNLNIVMWLIKVLHSLFLHEIWFLRNSTESPNTGTLSHLSVYIVESFSAFIWRCMLEGHSWFGRIKISFCIFESSVIVFIKKFRSCGGLLIHILLQAFCSFLICILEHSVVNLIDVRCVLLNLRFSLHVMLIVVI